MDFNKDAWRLIEAKVMEVVGAATQGVIKGKGDTLPTAADFVGQLFVRTGTTDPGLYAATGTTTPGWKAVELAS